MSTGITGTTRYVPRSLQTNKSGSKISTNAVVTTETLSAFLSQGISKRTVFFLKDGLAKYDVSAG